MKGEKGDALWNEQYQEMWLRGEFEFMQWRFGSSCVARRRAVSLANW